MILGWDEARDGDGRTKLVDEQFDRESSLSHLNIHSYQISSSLELLRNMAHKRTFQLCCTYRDVQWPKHIVNSLKTKVPIIPIIFFPAYLRPNPFSFSNPTCVLHTYICTLHSFFPNPRNQYHRTIPEPPSPLFIDPIIILASPSRPFLPTCLPNLPSLTFYQNLYKPQRW